MTLKLRHLFFKTEREMTTNTQHKDKQTVQSKLQSDPYSEKNISVFEKIFGKSYISPGGEDSASTFIRSLDLHEGQTVLDVACGAGGPAFLMARYKKEIYSSCSFCFISVLNSVFTLSLMIIESMGYLYMEWTFRQ